MVYDYIALFQNYEFCILYLEGRGDEKDDK